MSSCISTNNANKAFTSCFGRGSKAWRPHLTLERVKWWKAKNFMSNWPPRDGTPIMPIEPYGKGFFVYNARKNVQGLGDPRAPCNEETAKPYWVKDDYIKEMKLFDKKMGVPKVDQANFEKEYRGDGMSQEEAEYNFEKRDLAPMLCVVDYRSRVLGYLSKTEWIAFVKAIPKLKAQMVRFKDTIPPPSEDVDKIELDKRHFTYDKTRWRRIGSAGSNDNTSYGGFKTMNPRNGEFQRKFRKKNAANVMQLELAPILRMY